MNMRSDTQAMIYFAAIHPYILNFVANIERQPGTTNCAVRQVIRWASCGFTEVVTVVRDVCPLAPKALNMAFRHTRLQ